MKMVSFSQVKQDPESFFDSVVVNDGCVGIRRSDGEDVVTMSKKYYEALVETLYLLKEPANTAHLIESIAQYESRNGDE